MSMGFRRLETFVSVGICWISSLAHNIVCIKTRLKLISVLISRGRRRQWEPPCFHFMLDLRRRRRRDWPLSCSLRVTHYYAIFIICVYQYRRLSLPTRTQNDFYDIE